MNWGMPVPAPSRQYVSPQLPVEGIPGRVVNMDVEPISSLPQCSPILDEELKDSWTLNAPTDDQNHQVDAEARSLVDSGASS